MRTKTLKCKACGAALAVAPVGRTRRYCGGACRMRALRRRRKRSVHWRSDSCEWATPQEFFDGLNERLGPFTLDACATPENAKCVAYYTRAQDGLNQPWAGRVWCNPPYGRRVGRWLRKAWRAAASGAAELVVCLVPSRTDTEWWHEWATRAEVEFLKGRLRFCGGASAPFPSALLVFRHSKLRDEMSPLERCMERCLDNMAGGTGTPTGAGKASGPPACEQGADFPAPAENPEPAAVGT